MLGEARGSPPEMLKCCSAPELAKCVLCLSRIHGLCDPRMVAMSHGERFRKLKLFFDDLLVGCSIAPPAN